MSAFPGKKIFARHRRRRRRPNSARIDGEVNQRGRPGTGCPRPKFLVAEDHARDGHGVDAVVGTQASRLAECTSSETYPRQVSHDARKPGA